MAPLKYRHGQLTLFVIVAIIIITALVIGLIYFKQTSQVSPEQDIQGYIEKCINDGVKSSEAKLLENNGYMNLSSNYLVYYGQKVPYLCKATQFYVPCVNQEPMYIGHLKNEIKSDIEKKSQVCFSDLKYLLQKKGYTVDDGIMTLNLDIGQEGILVNIDKKFNVKTETESRSYNNFNSLLLSPIYTLAVTAERIVNYESTFCEFNNVGWMLMNPNSKVYRFVTSDGSKVYTLTDRLTNSSIKFAVKTCVMPAGI